MPLSHTPLGFPRWSRSKQILSLRNQMVYGHRRSGRPTGNDTRQPGGNDMGIIETILVAVVVIAVVAWILRRA